MQNKYEFLAEISVKSPTVQSVSNEMFETIDERSSKEFSDKDASVLFSHIKSYVKKNWKKLQNENKEEPNDSNTI